MAHSPCLSQDMGFTVKMASPGTEPFDIQVSSMELVQEIHQLLMDREDTCHRTCFSLQLDGNTLDNFAELKNIDGLKEGSIIKVGRSQDKQWFVFQKLYVLPTE